MVNKTYQVTVDSSGFSADWIRDVIVVAADKGEACERAERQIKESWPMETVTSSEAHELGVDNARVVGVLISQDEL